MMRIMSSLSPRFVLIIPILLLAATVASAGELRRFEHHVRTTDVDLRALIRHGVDTSPAFSAIVDGHITTVIAGVVLAQYGTGPLKGFAVTLIVGILCNIFTGVVVTRLFFEAWIRVLGRHGRLDMG